MSARLSEDYRYSSYDLCYGYFFSNRGHLINNNLEKSCLYLWAYLSSWGMVARGNELQDKSFAFLKPVVKYIQANPQYYTSSIDSPQYMPEMLELYGGLKRALRLNQKSQKTMITKIMLGVYGCIPAFDSRVSSFFKTTTIGNLSPKNIQSIIDFYTQRRHRNTIDNLARSTFLFDFSGTRLRAAGSINPSYSPAKIIDMIAFIR